MPEFSTIGVVALEEREDCRLEAYRDSKRIWTIACGITSASGLIDVRPGMVLTQAEAEALNVRAFELYANHVREALGGKAILQHQFDAFVSICFNIGPDAFRSSTFLRRFLAGDTNGAADAILMWVKPREVTSRRQAEYDQFRTPYSVSLPRARRTDAGTVRVALQGRVPSGPLAVPVPRPVPRLSLPPAPAPAPSGGLLGSFVDRLRAAFPVKKG